VVITTCTLKSLKSMKSMKTLKSIFDQCWFRAKHVYEILFVQFFQKFFRIPYIILDIYGFAKKLIWKLRYFWRPLVKHRKIAVAAAAAKQENRQPPKIAFGIIQDVAAWTKTLEILIPHIQPHHSILVPKQGKDQKSHHPHRSYRESEALHPTLGTLHVNRNVLDYQKTVREFHGHTEPLILYVLQAATLFPVWLGCWMRIATCRTDWQWIHIFINLVNEHISDQSFQRERESKARAEER
jgi:hypothetical protein